MKHIQKRLAAALQLASVDVVQARGLKGYLDSRLKAELRKVLHQLSDVSLWRLQCGDANREFMRNNFAVVRYVIETEGRLSFFDPKSKEPFTRMCGAIVATYEPLVSTIDGVTHRSPGRLLKIGASFCSAKHKHRFSKREALFRAIRSARPLEMAWMDKPTKLPQALAALLYGVAGSDSPSAILRHESPVVEAANAGS